MASSARTPCAGGWGAPAGRRRRGRECSAWVPGAQRGRAPALRSDGAGGPPRGDCPRGLRAGLGRRCAGRGVSSPAEHREAHDQQQRAEQEAGPPPHTPLGHRASAAPDPPAPESEPDPEARRGRGRAPVAGATSRRARGPPVLTGCSLRPRPRGPAPRPRPRGPAPPRGLGGGGRPWPAGGGGGRFPVLRPCAPGPVPPRGPGPERRPQWQRHFAAGDVQTGAHRLGALRNPAHLNTRVKSPPAR